MARLLQSVIQWLLMNASGQAARPPRVVLADDCAEVLEEIRSLLEPEFLVVSEACEGVALMEAVRGNTPDAVVADINMPGLNGMDAAAEIVGLGLCQAVVMLSMYDNPDLVQRALGAGIRGYVLKDDAGEELIPALRAALAGACYLSRGVAVGKSVKNNLRLY